jgi:hypothetical protein
MYSRHWTDGRSTQTRCQPCTVSCIELTAAYTYSKATVILAFMTIIFAHSNMMSDGKCSLFACPSAAYLTFQHQAQRTPRCRVASSKYLDLRLISVTIPVFVVGILQGIAPHGFQIVLQIWVSRAILITGKPRC